MKTSHVMKSLTVFAAFAGGSTFAQAMARDGSTLAQANPFMAWAGGGTLAQAMVSGASSLAKANPFADQVRAANARFRDVAVAVGEGYSPIACDSAPRGGGMGIHYVNGAYMQDKKPKVERPQAVMYEPEADGSLKLIAVEYISFKGPVSIEGHLMNFQNAPNSYGLKPFYEIHVWAWKANPLGTFADDNPTVSCDAMALPGNVDGTRVGVRYGPR